MKTPKLELNSCKECPYFVRGNPYSSDGFDRMEDWFCKNPELINKKISGAVEWHEENKIPIPDWCPLRL